MRISAFKVSRTMLAIWGRKLLSEMWYGKNSIKKWFEYLIYNVCTENELKSD